MSVSTRTHFSACSRVSAWRGAARRETQQQAGDDDDGGEDVSRALRFSPTASRPAATPAARTEPNPCSAEGGRGPALTVSTEATLRSARSNPGSAWSPASALVSVSQFLPRPKSLHTLSEISNVVAETSELRVQKSSKKHPYHNVTCCSADLVVTNLYPL